MVGVTGVAVAVAVATGVLLGSASTLAILVGGRETAGDVRVIWTNGVLDGFRRIGVAVWMGEVEKIKYPEAGNLIIAAEIIATIPARVKKGKTTSRVLYLGFALASDGPELDGLIIPEDADSVSGLGFDFSFCGWVNA